VLLLLLLLPQNAVLLVLSGYVIDRVGNRNSALLFLSLTVLGTFIVALSPTLRGGSSEPARTATFLFMLLGRFVFGLGAESSYGIECLQSVPVCHLCHVGPGLPSYRDLAKHSCAEQHVRGVVRPDEIPGHGNGHHHRTLTTWPMPLLYRILRLLTAL
jgi:hypothetical protein